MPKKFQLFCVHLAGGCRCFYRGERDKEREREKERDMHEDGRTGARGRKTINHSTKRATLEKEE
jgi:hypothetical protein